MLQRKPSITKQARLTNKDRYHILRYWLNHVVAFAYSNGLPTVNTQHEQMLVDIVALAHATANGGLARIDPKGELWVLLGQLHPSDGAFDFVAGAVTTSDKIATPNERFERISLLFTRYFTNGSANNTRFWAHELISVLLGLIQDRSTSLPATSLVAKAILKEDPERKSAIWKYLFVI